jgi:hypothetical protein
VLLACCHDTGYIPVLRHYAAQPLALERVTLLSGGNLRLDMSNLGFKTTDLFESLFSQGEWQVILQSSKSVRSKQKTKNAIAGGLQPQSPASPPESSALPVRNGSVSKSNGESTPSTERKTMTGWERLKPILRNNQGKRIDRPLSEDKNFIDAMRKADLCHYHYLKDDCKTNCHYNHNYSRPLTDREFEALWILSRQNRCHKSRRSGVCEDESCIFGHNSE